MNGRERQGEVYQKAAEEYGSALDRLAYAYEADTDRRRDLVQEIHLALWRSFEQFDGRCSLRTWVYRVAHNVATSYVIRQSKKNPRTFCTLEDLDALPSLEDVEVLADRKKSLARLLTLVQRLEPIDRQILLAYLEGTDAESIAEIAGLSVANVWTRIHRIKNVLARQFYAGGAHAR